METASLLQVQRKHIANKNQQEYEETVSYFEIGHRVSNIVTDNATYMVKAFNFSMPEFEMGSTASVDKSECYISKVSKGAKVRNRYNQVPHLNQDTNHLMILKPVMMIAQILLKRYQSIQVVLPTHCTVLWEIGLRNVEVT